MKLNKKAEESTSYLGGKTINVILGVVVALFIIFVIGRLAYNYVKGESDLQKAGRQFQNILEKIDFVREDIVSDSLNIYPPEGWFLKSDEAGDIKDEQCLMRSCLCICEDVYCRNENRICKGFDYRVEVADDFTQVYEPVGPGAPAKPDKFENTLKLKSIERLRITLSGFLDDSGSKVERVVIKEIE